MPRPNGMTVSELKDALEGYSDDTPVYFTYDYGDHWHTTVALEVTNVEEGAVKYSDYHRMPKVDDEADENNVLLLS